LLYQVVDDVLDGDGLASALGSEGAQELAAELEEKARSRLDEISPETTTLSELLSSLRQRVS
jgi:geranylgeranyl pyrophosphate synthase